MPKSNSRPDNLRPRSAGASSSSSSSSLSAQKRSANSMDKRKKPEKKIAARAFDQSVISTASTELFNTIVGEYPYDESKIPEGIFLNTYDQYQARVTNYLDKTLARLRTNQIVPFLFHIYQCWVNNNITTKPYNLLLRKEPRAISYSRDTAKHIFKKYLPALTYEDLTTKSPDDHATLLYALAHILGDEDFHDLVWRPFEQQITLDDLCSTPTAGPNQELPALWWLWFNYDQTKAPRCFTKAINQFGDKLTIEHIRGPLLERLIFNQHAFATMWARFQHQLTADDFRTPVGHTLCHNGSSLLLACLRYHLDTEEAFKATFGNIWQQFGATFTQDDLLICFDEYSHSIAWHLQEEFMDHPYLQPLYCQVTSIMPSKLKFHPYVSTLRVTIDDDAKLLATIKLLAGTPITQLTARFGTFTKEGLEAIIPHLADTNLMAIHFESWTPKPFDTFKNAGEVERGLQETLLSIQTSKIFDRINAERTAGSPSFNVNDWPSGQNKTYLNFLPRDITEEIKKFINPPAAPSPEDSQPSP